MPFSALKGYEEAVRESEKRDKERKLLGEDAQAELDMKLRSLSCGDRVCVLHYEEGEYRVKEGTVLKIGCLDRRIDISGKEISIQDIYDVEELS